MNPENHDVTRRTRMEKLLAAQLYYGTWGASLVTALGMLLARFEGPPGSFMVRGIDLMTAGIALFILLPVFRLASMLIVFLRERDYPFAALTTLVLTIIGLGVALGLYWPK